MIKDTTAEISQQMFQLLKSFSRLKWSQHPCPDLKPSECELLGILYLSTLDTATHAISASELSSSLMISPAGVTHLVNPLEEGGYIQRLKDPDDRRVVLISLTAKGIHLAKALVQQASQRLSELVNHLGEQDSLAFIRIMSSVLNYFLENPVKP